MKEYSLLAAEPLRTETPHPTSSRRPPFSPWRGKNDQLARSRAEAPPYPGRSGSDPSSGPRRLVRTPVAVHLLPWGEGEHSIRRRALKTSFSLSEREEQSRWG